MIIALLLFRIFQVSLSDIIQIEANKKYYLDFQDKIYEGETQLLKNSNPFDQYFSMNFESDFRVIKSIILETNIYILVRNNTLNQIIDQNKNILFEFYQEGCFDLTMVSYNSYFFAHCLDFQLQYYLCNRFQEICQKYETKPIITPQLDAQVSTIQIRLDGANYLTLYIEGLGTKLWKIYIFWNYYQQFTYLKQINASDLPQHRVLYKVKAKYSDIKNKDNLLQNILVYAMDDESVFKMNLSNPKNISLLTPTQFESYEIVDFEINQFIQSTNLIYKYKVKSTNQFYIRYKIENSYINQHTKMFIFYNNQIILANQTTVFTESQKQSLTFDNPIFIDQFLNYLIIIGMNDFYAYKVTKSSNYLQYINQHDCNIKNTIHNIKELPLFIKNSNIQNYFSYQILQVENNVNISNQYNLYYQSNQFSQFNGCFNNESDQFQYIHLMQIIDYQSYWLIQQKYQTFLIVCHNNVMISKNELDVLDYILTQKLVCESESRYVYAINKLSGRYIYQGYTYRNYFRSESQLKKEGFSCLFQNRDEYQASIHRQYSKNINGNKINITVNDLTIIIVNQQTISFIQTYSFQYASIIDDKLIKIVDEQTLKVYSIMEDCSLVFLYSYTIQQRINLQEIIFKSNNNIGLISTLDENNVSYFTILDFSLLYQCTIIAIIEDKKQNLVIQNNKLFLQYGTEVTIITIEKNEETQSKIILEESKSICQIIIICLFVIILQLRIYLKDQAQKIYNE